MATPRRWLVLVVIFVAGLVVVFAFSVVFVCVVAAVVVVGLLVVVGQWFVRWFGLGFGVLLLVCGGLSGRWWHCFGFTIGLLWFGGCWVVGGVGFALEFVLVARLGDGAFAVVVVAAVLPLVFVAFVLGVVGGGFVGVFGGVGCAGGVVGVVLGVRVPDFLCWLLGFLVGVFFVVACLVGRVVYLAGAGFHAGGLRVGVLVVVVVLAVVAGFVFGLGGGFGLVWGCFWGVVFVVGALVLLGILSVVGIGVFFLVVALQVVVRVARVCACLGGVLAFGVVFCVFVVVFYCVESVVGFPLLRCGFGFVAVVVFLLVGSGFVGRGVVVVVGGDVVVFGGYLFLGVGVVLVVGVVVGGLLAVVVLAARLFVGVCAGGAFPCFLLLFICCLGPRGFVVSSGFVGGWSPVGGAVGAALVRCFGWCVFVCAGSCRACCGGGVGVCVVVFPCA
ncbi:hypothetical protein [Arthrobacter sp. cf158]|uniref:hypothetical protein n=1 Tax=Arthrobacter sp. cf158 TaxID=1761744 RepID=UPI001C319DA2|nr:hypothetical protein [Arthrobacter sp. cf158]